MTPFQPTGRPSLRSQSAASPFDRPALLWLLVATGLYALYPLAAFRDVVWQLSLPDTDDTMRLVQVRDLLAGQGWFDMSQHRLMPPAGASMHWSRLVDAPLAALIGLATPLAGRPLAEGLVTALWPPALFGLYLALVYRAVAVRFGGRAARLSLFAAVGTTGLAALFAFGRIDHHNIQVLLILGLGLSIADARRSRGRAILGGALAAASLAVGLEALPFIALASLVLLVDWVLEGEAALPALMGFTLGLAALGPLLFGVQTDPHLWLATRCDALSPPWLGMGCAGAATALAAFGLGRHLTNPLRRAAFAGLCGAATLAGFAILFPACLSGPFQGLPASVRAGWLDHVVEMQPFRALLASQGAVALTYVAPLLLAGLVAALAAWRGPPEIRRPAGLAALFLLAGFGLAQFQIRGIYIASGFVALVAGPVLDHAITLLRRDGPPWRRIAWLALAVLMIARVWTALGALPERATGVPASDSGPLASARQSAHGQDCTGRADLAPLEAIAPGTILARLDAGPAILLHTHHGVVAAPYHRAIAGLTASIEGLDGDEDALRRAVVASGASYLALCPAAETGRPAAFAERLAAGGATTAWLARVPLAATPLAVWRVRPPE